MDLLHGKSGAKKEFIRIVVLIIASAIIAFNLKSFVRTGGLFPGGFSGITVLIQQIAEQFFHITLPYSAIYVPLNLIPIYIGFKFIGKRFTLYSCLVIVLSSVLTDIMPAFTITYDIVLICIFGGLINGVAIALCLFVGASAGGTDFISIYFSEKKGIDTWNFVFMGNVCILVVAGVLFGFDKALYSIIFQFTTTQILQGMYKKYQKQTLWIITEQPNVVYGRIKEITNHDATLFRGIGCYEGTERNMVYSVVSSEEVDRVIKEIKDADPKAFINVTKTEQLDGRFYKRPND
ncbi:MAG TPA: YitT family protein [Anaerovoracaceae bacterium]|nr:YitT family protein [Anaerovoracaceae bacterium]